MLILIIIEFKVQKHISHNIEIAKKYVVSDHIIIFPRNFHIFHLNSNYKIYQLQGTVVTKILYRNYNDKI